MENQKITSIQSSIKAFLSLAVCAFALGYGIYFFSSHLVLEGCVFCIIGIIFLVAFVLFISYVTVTSESISLKTFGICRKSLKWKDIHEVGVIGTRVFNKGNSKKVGQLLIYFSTKSLSDTDRFNLAIKKLPQYVITTPYEADKIEAIQFIWSSDITLYNVGDLEL